MATVQLTPDGAKRHALPESIDVPDIANDQGMLYAPIKYKDKYIKLRTKDGAIHIFEPTEVIKVTPT